LHYKSYKTLRNHTEQNRTHYDTIKQNTIEHITPKSIFFLRNHTKHCVTNHKKHHKTSQNHTEQNQTHYYEVATISMLLKIIGFFFAKETYKRDDILQERPAILRSQLIEATL